MSDQPEGRGQKSKRAASKHNPVTPPQREDRTLHNTDEPGAPDSAQDRRGHYSRPTLGFVRRLTLSEWLTFLVGVGSLVVSYLTYKNAADTRDIQSAIRNLSELATQTKRQADASQVQVGLLTDQLDATRKQAAGTVTLAGAAGRSADVATAQLREVRDEKRPWVAVSDPSVLPQNMEENSYGERWLAVKITASGQRPALKVNIVAKLIESSSKALAEQTILCTQPERASATPELTLFPNQSRQVRIANVSRRYLPAKGGFFNGSIVGCALYSDEAGRRHRTGFAYDLRQMGTKEPGYPGPVDASTSLNSLLAEPPIAILPNIAGTGRAD